MLALKVSVIVGQRRAWQRLPRHNRWCKVHSFIAFRVLMWLAVACNLLPVPAACRSVVLVSYWPVTETATFASCRLKVSRSTECRQAANDVTTSHRAFWYRTSPLVSLARGARLITRLYCIAEGEKSTCDHWFAKYLLLINDGKRAVLIITHWLYNG